MATYNLIWTLDYEIHGNGDGNPLELMVEPTYRLMNLLEKYHQRLTIMADVAEILRFKRYAEEAGRDDYHVAEIEEQLREAIRRGHDVQLHIHSSYFNSQYKNGAFDQCIEEYNMAALPIERIDEMVGQCVAYLEQLLRPIKKDYKVWLFRAANWSMMPTENLYRVLVKYGITHDTSVFKGGVQGGNVCYDYREAYDNLFAYPASMKNINERDEKGQLTELPIYTEMRPLWDFISPIRIFRMVRAKFHRHKKYINHDKPAEGAININKEEIKNAHSTPAMPDGPRSLERNHLQAPTSELAAPVDANTPNLLPDEQHVECSQKCVSLTKNDKNVLAEMQKSANKDDNRHVTWRSVFRLSPMKMDFNQVSARGLRRMMRNAMKRIRGLEIRGLGDERVSVVLIGHSKTFVPYNEVTLEPFLKWVSKES